MPTAAITRRIIHGSALIRAASASSAAVRSCSNSSFLLEELTASLLKFFYTCGLQEYGPFDGPSHEPLEDYDIIGCYPWSLW